MVEIWISHQGWGENWSFGRQGKDPGSENAWTKSHGEESFITWAEEWANRKEFSLHVLY